MKLNVCLVTFLVLLNSAVHGSSIYFQPTYCSSYIAPQGRAVIASNAPSSQQQSAQNGNAKRYWAVNQGSESAGTVTAYFGAPGLQDTPLGGTVAGYAQSGGGGNAQGYLARYSATGVLDTTFANQGVLLFSFPGDGGTNTIQSYCSDGSGGCYVGGQTGNVKPAIITHVTSAGTIDTTFGTSGYTQTTGSGIIGIGVQSTGAIVYWDGAHVNRLLSSGQPDSSFTSVALSATSSHANAFAVDNEDRILVLVNPMAGTKAVYRINPNGGLDTTFASGGHYAISNGYALCVFADNSIAVGGGSNAFVTKSSSAGLLDTTFGTGGTTTFAPLNSGNWIYGMTLLPSRQIASVGTGYDGVSYWYIVVILNANGTFDTYFSIPGQSTSVGAGTAQYRIPTGTSGTAFSFGSLPLSNQLVVAGASGYGSGNVTLMFYLVGA